jgi:hypothetical protein
MSHSVVLILRSPPEPWLKGSILQKSDIDLKLVETYEAGFQQMATAPCTCFVVFDASDTPDLVGFVERLLFDLPGAIPKGVVVTPQRHPALERKPVDARIEPPGTLEAFNAAVARALGLPVRAHKRYLVRLNLGMVGSGNKYSTLTTVNVSAGGLLVECEGELPVGEAVKWSFAGIEGLRGLEIPGRILREVEEMRAGDVRCYAIQFDVEAKAQRERLAQWLADQPPQGEIQEARTPGG